MLTVDRVYLIARRARLAVEVSLPVELRALLGLVHVTPPADWGGGPC